MSRGVRMAEPQARLKSYLKKLRKRRIIETLAAFIGGGWLILEFVHWILVDHYHFPEKSIDITFVTILGALLCTLIWRWFSGREAPRKFKLELVLMPLVLLITVRPGHQSPPSPERPGIRGHPGLPMEKFNCRLALR